MRSRTQEIGQFLRARRESIDPDGAGVVSYGKRRVSGLRREELAQLAGVSASYYTRIEQGQAPSISPEVLDALARALKLDSAEREHLLRLSHPLGANVADSGLEQPTPELLGLLAHLSNVPAALLGRSLDVLAWTPPARELFAPHVALEAPDDPATRPNWARMLFLDPALQAGFANWDMKADDAVAFLRHHRALYPDDRYILSVVDDLNAASPLFEARWSAHVVSDKGRRDTVFTHARLGDLELTHQAFRVSDHPDWLLGTYFPRVGSASAARLSAAVAQSQT